MKNTKHRTLSIIGTACLLAIAGFLITGCTSGDKIEAQTSIPGYKASIEFNESFESDLSNWIIAGDMTCSISENGQLVIQCDSTEQSCFIWQKEEWDGSFQVEYEMDFHRSNGTASVLFCSGPETEGNITDTAPEYTRPEDFDKNIGGYQIACHCDWPPEAGNSGSQLRKNPGQYLMSRSPVDPCQANRFYLMDVAKTGNRIQFFVDNAKIHDLRDRGGFSESYKQGHIGFWIHGGPGFKLTLDNVRIFKLSPR